MNIIDALVFTLGLDSKPYEEGAAKVGDKLDDLGEKSDQVQDRMDKAGQGARKGFERTSEEADKTGRTVEGAGKKGADGFENLTKQAAKFLALIGGSVALKRFVEQTVTANASIQRLSLNLTEDVRSISAWSNEAELAGGSGQELQNTLSMLSMAQTELQLTGESALIPYFSALGVSLTDVGGKAKPATDILIDLADRLERLPRTQANNMGLMMGLDQGTLNLLLRGRQEVELLIARQEEQTVITERQAEEGFRLARSYGKLRKTFSATGRELLSSGTPALEKVLSILQSIGNWIRENSETVTVFMASLAGGLALIGAAAIPISATAAAVVGLAAGIALLWDDYQTWKEGADSLLPWEKWQDEISLAKKALTGFSDFAGDIFYRAAAAGDMIAGKLAGDEDRAGYAAGEFLHGRGPVYRPPEPQPEGPAPGMIEETQQKAIQFFMEQGWSQDQAAGIVGNITRESYFNPAAVGDNGQAYGIAQWHPDRQADFKARFGKDMAGSTIEEQLSFIQYELTLGKEKAAGDALWGAQSATEAGAIISRQYERPANPEIEAALRGMLSNDLLQTLKQPLGFMPGIPGAGAATMGAGASMGAMQFPRELAGSASTTEVHIGEIKINTNATDSDGIARDIGRSLNYLFTSQANSGMVS
jgi:hypothetical protein